MTTPETPESRKKRLAAARQARYVERKRASGLVVGAAVPQCVLDALPALTPEVIAVLPALTPEVVKLLKSGRAIRPALTDEQVSTFKLGQKVQKILRAEGGLKAAARAAALRSLLD
jgi:hypothetical protein